jgi:hypothetical protein
MICPVVRRVSKTIEFELERKFTGSCRKAANVGESVEPESIIAHCEVSAGQRLIKIAHNLGVSAKDVGKYLLRKVGDRIYRGEIIARKKQALGLGKKEIKSPADGVITEIDTNGDIIVKFLPTPVRLVAGASGVISRIGQESVFLKTVGIQVKGYAGDGRERDGLVKIIAKPDEFIIPQKITGDCGGRILVGGSLLERSAIEKAVTIGVHGIIVGGINHRDFLSLGVGTDIGTTVLVTEGFGAIPMGKDIYEALKKAESRFAFVSGEAKSFFVPERVSAQVESPSKVSWKELAVGDIVRVLKPQGSDLIGKVESLSTKEEILNSGLSAEAASVKFLSGDIRTVASANLEIVDI